MSDFKLTEEQQVIMDELVREAKAARQRLDSSDWEAKGKRRNDLFDVSPGNLTVAERTELKEIEDEMWDELGSIQAPDLYRSELQVARLEAKVGRLKAERTRANT